jgi:hypothetical protein
VEVHDTYGLPEGPPACSVHVNGRPALGVFCAPAGATLPGSVGEPFVDVPGGRVPVLPPPQPAITSTRREMTTGSRNFLGSPCAGAVPCHARQSPLTSTSTPAPSIAARLPQQHILMHLLPIARSDCGRTPAHQLFLQTKTLGGAAVAVASMQRSSRHIIWLLFTACFS